MFNPVKSLREFLSYWYFRYLMVTELYMVEKWEQNFCNVTIIVFLGLLSYLNYKILDYSGALRSGRAMESASI